ncbi:putative O-glycosylation ligase, exosortase A system-associated [Methylocaldum sp.]|uniref:putative O-glycosylation ligase, exosortase A system-associated n=1 Tax=Methylocaldum sp. TaxID=1969727 RepID=UPI002D28B262|nr:putative O-glycosylation ligase, exosortase A system-associated [Methylocaldum sp.]HYE37946.1 putative O-glycosylation ligase, exosortase A system-associated [Methylocaldum sp.]
MPLRDVFVTVVVFGLLPKILSRPDIGLLLWCWLSYMNPHKLSWQFAHDFPFALITALAILLGLLIWKEPKKVPWTSIPVILLIFIGWIFLTTLFAIDQEGAWEQWNKVWKIQLMTFVVIMVMTTKWRINAMVSVIALSLGFYGFKGGIFTVLTGGAYAVYGPGGSFIAGNNEIGLALIMTIPLLRYLQLSVEQQRLKQGLGLAILLCVISIVGTQSRGALLGLAAMIFFLIAKSRKKGLLILVLIVSIPTIIAFMPESWHARMSTIKTYEQDDSAMGRINAWTMAFNLAKDRIMGGGFECFRPITFSLYAPNPDDVHDAHSIYFEILGEHGFVGLALFLLLWVSGWRAASAAIRIAKRSDETRWISDLCSMIQVSLIGYATAGAFLGLAYFDLYYNLLAILVLCTAILNRKSEVNTQEKDLENPLAARSRAIPRKFIKERKKQLIYDKEG